MSSGSRELIGFLSFSFQDSDLARKLRNCIERELSLRTDEAIHFWRPDEVPPVDRDAVGQAIALSDFFIPLISPSFAESAHCQSELARFFENDPTGSRIFPIICVSRDESTPDVLPERLIHHQLYDLHTVASGSIEFAAIIQRLSENIVKVAEHTLMSENQLLRQLHDALVSRRSQSVVSKNEVATVAEPATPGVPTNAARSPRAEFAIGFSPTSEIAQSRSGTRRAAKDATLADVLNAQDRRRRWEQAWRNLAMEERRLTNQIEQIQARGLELERRVQEEIRQLKEETNRLEAAKHTLAVEKRRLDIERPTAQADSHELPLRLSQGRGAA